MVWLKNVRRELLDTSDKFGDPVLTLLGSDFAVLLQACTFWTLCCTAKSPVLLEPPC